MPMAQPIATHGSGEMSVFYHSWQAAAQPGLNSNEVKNATGVIDEGTSHDHVHDLQAGLLSLNPKP